MPDVPTVVRTGGTVPAMATESSAADAPVLSERARNRAVLARQQLLARSPAALPAVLDTIGGIQAQYAPSMYVGLWSRVDGFERHQLTSALVDRSVVQGTLMRATIHLVSAADYWPLTIAVRDHRRRWWLQTQRFGLTEDRMIEAARRTHERLASGPVTHADLAAHIGKDAMAGIHEFVDLVRVPPSGTWAKRRADRYALATSWIGPEPDLSPTDALRHAISRYLGAFGPSRPRDIATWAGVPAAATREALAEITLSTYRAEDGDELVDLVGLELPDPEVVAPVRFLPTWDATMLVHARGTGIVREDDRPRIFTSKNPQSISTFLVDGVVAGSWRHDGRRVIIEPFRPLAKDVQVEVRAEGDRIADLFTMTEPEPATT